MTGEGFTPEKDTSGGNGRSWEKAILAKEEVLYSNTVIHFLVYTNDSNIPVVSQ